MIRSLLFSLPLLFVLVAGCKSDYKLLQSRPVDAPCVDRLLPRGLETAWFTTSVDVLGNHISGLLFVKQQPGGLYRVVFTNEFGVTFFDFEFGPRGHFVVRDIIDKLDRKPVIITFRKDFQLLLGLSFRGDVQGWRQGGENYYGVAQKKETAYFITDAECASLQRLELGSRRKRKVTERLFGVRPAAPDSVQILHHTFAMEIRLKKFVKE
jgi:hypothetical protein